MDDQHEEVEHIPWGELMASGGDRGRRVLYLGAGALGALVVGILGARLFSSPPPAQPDPVPVAVETTVPVTVTVLVPVPETVPEAVLETTTTTTLPPLPVLYREADLMAFPADWAARAAMARAEWFVTDFFTADLEPNGSADIRGALPVGVVMPVMPQDGVVGLSYVEWARAFRVVEGPDGVYRVSVAYRMLGAPPERGFQRLPVRAVEVRVAVSPSGGTVVVDLPAPAVLPAGPDPGPWPVESEVAPPVVVEGAMGVAARWGWEHRVLGAGRVPGGWRVLLSAADELGNRWPLAVYVDDQGAPLG